VSGNELAVQQRGKQRWNSQQVWTVAVAGIGQFMVALDTLVVTTCLPALRTSLHASLQSLEWTLSCTGSTQPGTR
jgi:hypothetical protein